MDLNSILPLIMNLFSTLQNSSQNNNSTPQQTQPQQPTDYNNAFFQLPTYDYPTQPNTPPQPQQTQQTQNTPQNQSSQLDINTIVEILKTLSQIFPQKKKTPEPPEQVMQDVSHSYISKLPRTDKFNFD